MTLPGLLAQAAQRHGGRPALARGDAFLTHAELQGCTGRAAAALAARGVRPGDVVGVSMQSSPLQLVTLLALARAGACSVHVFPEHPRAVREALAAQFGIAAVICDPDAAGAWRADPAWLVAASGGAFADRAAPEAPWRIPLSSGTTGMQKAIRVTHAMAVGEIASAVPAEPVGAEHRFLCHRGLDSNWSLMTALMHLAAGGMVAFPRTRRMASFVEAAKRHQATHLIMAPAFLRDLVDALPAGAGGLPAVRSLLVGGAALPPALVTAALERVTPHLFTGYGATEVGLPSLADAALMRRAPHSAGRLRPGFDAEAVDESGARVAPGSTGILRFRRHGMAREYFRNPEATARAYRDGWFYPGDQGSIDAEGLLAIGGRVDDKLNLDGIKVEPGPIERALEEHPAVAEAAAFTASPRGRALLYAAVVLRAKADGKALLAHCEERVGRALTPRQVFVVARLPRNEGGKLVRASLSRRVRRPQA